MKLYSLRSRQDEENGESGEKVRNVRLSGGVVLLIALVLVVLTAIISFAVAHKIYSDRLERDSTYKVKFESSTDPYIVAKFQDIVDSIEDSFALEYDPDALLESAIAAYVEGLGDRFSYYIEPGDYDSYDNYITGTYVGIGVSYTRDESGLKIEEVFSGTPAESAGLKAGEIITHIGGIGTADITDEEVQTLLGTAGVTIKLTVSDGSGSLRDVDVTIALINKQSVYGVGYEDGVYYIRISQFDSDTGEEFKKMLSLAEESGMKALVLDLRTNGGGYAREAAAVSDALLGEGVVAYSEDKYGNRSDVAESDANEVTVPVMLLVNQNTASASELVTGAFRDFHKGTIIGVKTYGKAIGQISRNYDKDGSGLVITIATYYTPSGECIHGVGITPDVTVTLEDEYARLTPDNIPDGKDAQLDKALEIVRQQLAENG